MGHLLWNSFAIIFTASFRLHGELVQSFEWLSKYVYELNWCLFTWGGGFFSFFVNFTTIFHHFPNLSIDFDIFHSCWFLLLEPDSSKICILFIGFCGLNLSFSHVYFEIGTFYVFSFCYLTKDCVNFQQVSFDTNCPRLGLGFDHFLVSCSRFNRHLSPQKCSIMFIK